MTKSKVERIIRPLTADEKARHARIREQVEHEFPPAEKKQQPAGTGIAAALRQTRKTRGLTYEAVAREAGLANGNAVKDVEYGRNTDLSAVEAIAKALGLKLELVEA
jgi:DNA-binding phage protein